MKRKKNTTKFNRICVDVKGSSQETKPFSWEYTNNKRIGTSTLAMELTCDRQACRLCARTTRTEQMRKKKHTTNKHTIGNRGRRRMTHSHTFIFVMHTIIVGGSQMYYYYYWQYFAVHFSYIFFIFFPFRIYLTYTLLRFFFLFQLFFL